MTENEVRVAPAGRIVLMWTLLAVHVVLAAVSLWMIPFLAMRSAACDTQCDFATADAAILWGRIAVMSILGLTIVLLSARWNRWERNWPIPLGGIVLTIAAVIVSDQILRAALPPL